MRDTFKTAVLATALVCGGSLYGAGIGDITVSYSAYTHPVVDTGGSPYLFSINRREVGDEINLAPAGFPNGRSAYYMNIPFFVKYKGVGTAPGITMDLRIYENDGGLYAPTGSAKPNTTLYDSGAQGGINWAALPWLNNDSATGIKVGNVEVSYADFVAGNVVNPGTPVMVPNHITWSLQFGWVGNANLFDVGVPLYTLENAPDVGGNWDDGWFFDGSDWVLQDFSDPDYTNPAGGHVVPLKFGLYFETVPDSGSSIMMLGTAMAGLCWIRRRRA